MKIEIINQFTRIVISKNIAFYINHRQGIGNKIRMIKTYDFSYKTKYKEDTDSVFLKELLEKSLITQEEFLQLLIMIK